MDVSALLYGVASNAVWAFVALLGGSILFAVVRWFKKQPLASYRTGSILRKQGVTRFVFSRDEYPERLANYLARARHSIQMVSITLKLTAEESALREVFSKKLASHDNFTVAISLMRPGSAACTIAADSLGTKQGELAKEIEGMLEQLCEFRDRLPDGMRERFSVTTHTCFPMGSAILLDATPDAGTIQVETKLFGAPRIESFSFEVVGPSMFYSRNYTAWRKILDRSKSYGVASGRSRR